MAFNTSFTSHYDEELTIYTVFYAGNNLLRPDHFWHPMLLPELLFVIYGCIYILGLGLRIWTGTQQFFQAYLSDPALFLLSGRLSTVLISTATVALVYKVGQQFYNRKVGLFAALFLSVAFIPVQEAHYIKEDTYIGFIVVLLFITCVNQLQHASTRRALMIGILLGMLAALKYNFFICLPLVFLTYYFLYQRRKRSVAAGISAQRGLLVSLLSSGLIFFALNPYMMFESARAMSELQLAFGVTTQQWVSSGGLPVWLYYFIYHFRYGFGESALVLSGIGVVMIFAKVSQKNLLLLTTPLTFFIVLVIFGGENFSRYAVMIIPILSLIAAFGVDSLKRYIIAGSMLHLILVVFLGWGIFTEAKRVSKFNYYLTKPDTRLLAKQWIQTTIPANSKLVNEGAIRSEYPAIFGPPLLPSAQFLDRRIKDIQAVGQSVQFVNELRAVVDKKIGYDLIGTPRLDRIYDEKSQKYTVQNLQEYVDLGYCYIVSSSWAKGDRLVKRDESFMESLYQQYKPIKIFSPQPVFAEDPIWRVDFPTLDRLEWLDMPITAGPVIRVFQALTPLCQNQNK